MSAYYILGEWESSDLAQRKTFPLHLSKGFCCYKATLSLLISSGLCYQFPRNGVYPIHANPRQAQWMSPPSPHIELCTTSTFQCICIVSGFHSCTQPSLEHILSHPAGFNPPHFLITSLLPTLITLFFTVITSLGFTPLTKPLCTDDTNKLFFNI